MKLFHKIFLCFIAIFGITFHAAGYLLINFSYERTIEQEKTIAFQDFQYNRYILQSILYFEPKFFDIEVEEAKNMLKSFTVPVFLVEANSRKVIQNMGELPTEFPLNEVADDKLSYQIYKDGREVFILVCDYVNQGSNETYLVTKTDISSVEDDFRNMTSYFQRIYMVVLGISFPLIFLLTKMVTASIQKVGEAARRIAQGDYSQRICTKGRDEVGELAADFNRMAAQIEEKIEELADAARQKEDFTANFAHELKTPMTSVIGYADMLYQSDLPRKEVKSAAGYILEEGMRLEALSFKLMDLFVLDRQKFILERMSALEALGNLQQGIGPMCKEHGASLHMEVEEGCIRADFDLFKTMVLNLADNAVKAGSRDLWVSGKQRGDFYEIKIRDNGRGIPKSELARITEAFYMVDKSRSRKQHGAGLGMTLVAKIAEIHGAKLEIESDGETGTSVSLAFYMEKGDHDEQNM